MEEAEIRSLALYLQFVRFTNPKDKAFLSYFYIL